MHNCPHPQARLDQKTPAQVIWRCEWAVQAAMHVMQMKCLRDNCTQVTRSCKHVQIWQQLTAAAAAEMQNKPTSSAPMGCTLGHCANREHQQPAPAGHAAAQTLKPHRNCTICSSYHQMNRFLTLTAAAAAAARRALHSPAQPHVPPAAT